MPSSDSLIHRGLLADEAVETRALADVAVTAAKLNAPGLVTVGYAAGVQNTALNASTYVTLGSATLEVPSWAGETNVLAFASLQASNDSGAAQNHICRVEIGGVHVAGTHREFTLSHNTTGTAMLVGARTITSPGSTITANLRAKVNTSTADLNISYVTLFGVHER